MAVLTILTAPASAQSQRLDSVDISLLTCGPGEEVWSLYGHTALRIHDRASGQDIAANWGLFSLGKDYFVLRFVFGLTDYQMGIAPMADFLAQYRYEGRWMIEQRLRLTAAQKQAILETVSLNYRPENREYRYNFFYDNCTTRVRDIIFSVIGEENVRQPRMKRTPTTYRKEIHRWNETHRWARFGNDLLLGVAADRTISQAEAQFLPTNLMEDVDYALSDSTGYLIQPKDVQAAVNTEKVVGTEKAVEIDKAGNTQADNAESDNALADNLTPQLCLIALCVVVFLLSFWESEKHQNHWWLDALLLALTGLPGLILLAMVFSQHPTVQVNLQILLLCPLHLVFLWPTVKHLRACKSYWYMHLVAVLAILALIINAVKIQDFAEGMEYLALSLLIRYAAMLAKQRRQKALKTL